MKLNRKVTWDPKKEKFVKDKEATKMMARKVTDPQYDLALIMKKAGLKY
jgi:hypothetical protein